MSVLKHLCSAARPRATFDYSAPLHYEGQVIPGSLNLPPSCQSSIKEITYAGTKLPIGGLYRPRIIMH